MGGLSPWQAKCKTGAPLAYILILSILLVFNRLLFFAFFEVFSFFSASIDIHMTFGFIIISYLFLSIG